VFHPSDHFCIFAPTGPCFSRAEAYRAGCSTPGGVSPEQSRGADSPPLTCWPLFFLCRPGYCYLFRLWANIAVSCWASHQTACPSPSPQCCSQPTFHAACIFAWDCPTHMQDLALGLGSHTVFWNSLFGALGTHELLQLLASSGTHHDSWESLTETACIL